MLKELLRVTKTPSAKDVGLRGHVANTRSLGYVRLVVSTGRSTDSIVSR